MSAHDRRVARLRAALPGHSPVRIEIDGIRHAAVAILLVDRDGDTMVPFTVRAPDLSTHPGHVALPGGRVDPGEGAVAAALRETDEELAVPSAAVSIIGELDDLVTSSGYAITPVVGELDGAVSYRPNPAEVASVFEAPATLFADPSAAEQMGERTFRGHTYPIRSYRWRSHRIWGATARAMEALAAYFK